jgi:hypothetical protein
MGPPCSFVDPRECTKAEIFFGSDVFLPRTNDTQSPAKHRNVHKQITPDLVRAMFQRTVKSAHLKGDIGRSMSP